MSNQTNPFAVAFAIGYFYGRAYPSNDQMPELPAQDRYHSENIGFVAGIEAGRRDYQEVDLPIVAEAANIQPDEIEAVEHFRAFAIDIRTRIFGDPK